MSKATGYGGEEYTDSGVTALRQALGFPEHVIPTDEKSAPATNPSAAQSKEGTQQSLSD